MKTIKLIKFLPLALLILVISCKDDNSSIPSPVQGLYFNYAPNEVGRIAVYDVSLITKDEFTGNQDTLSYQLKELIESEFTDLSGRKTQRLELYTRADSTQPWVISDVWTANLLSDRYEKKEENITYVKLRFPLVEGNVWNGNLYNNLAAQEYSLTSLNTPSILNGLSFDSTLTVLQSDYEDLLEKSFAVEKYATGAGLIYKESIFIKKDFNNPGSIKAQTKYRQTLVSYSN
ncbi:MAG: hypothetical protein ACKOKB_00845 [Bacteroidota bacterium]